MIVAGWIQLGWYILGFFTSLLPNATVEQLEYGTLINDNMELLFQYVANANWILPIDFMLYTFLLMIVVESAFLTFYIGKLVKSFIK